MGKSNVLTYMYELWNRVFAEIGAEYPDVKREYYHVDATCLYMIASPEMFDVIVTENMFGDIITDLAAITQGGLGIAAGGNLNPEGVSMFEPIGGTAPMWTGKNAINPLAAICAGAMLLETLGEKKAADRIEKGVMKVIEKDMKSMEAGKDGALHHPGRGPGGGVCFLISDFQFIQFLLHRAFEGNRHKKHA